RDLPRTDDEVRGALRDGDRNVGERLQHAVGDLLEPGRTGEIGVLVKDGRHPPQGAGETAERRGTVAVQVQDVDLPLVDDPQERRQRQGIELRSIEIGDVDTKRVERFLGEILLAEADQRYLEAVAI